MKIYLNNQEQLEALSKHIGLGFTNTSDSVSIEHEGRAYKKVGTYSLNVTQQKHEHLFSDTFFKTLFSLGVALTFENVRDDWQTILSGKREYQVFLAQGNEKIEKISGQSNQHISKTTSVGSKSPLIVPQLVSCEMIWNKAPYNEFTDLIYYNNQFFCCFRESNDPQTGDNGTIRVLSSPDAKTWNSVASLDRNNYDLRDPKFSITPAGRLMLNCGATFWSHQNETLNSAVSFSSDGTNWKPVEILPYPGQWMWRVTWNNNLAYTASYSFADREKGTFKLNLMTSPDGVAYTTLKEFDLPESPSETTLRFLPDHTMVALVRCNSTGLIGLSTPPYDKWTWDNIKMELGGPDFLILDDGQMWASTRAVDYAGKETTILAEMAPHSFTPVLTLPSGGDCSYPGMVFNDGHLYISYYSSKTETSQTSIYLAKIKLNH